MQPSVIFHEEKVGVLSLDDLVPINEVGNSQPSYQTTRSILIHHG